MPRVSEEHLSARRRQIVEAALRCFARDGIHPTSMQDIFREAGLSAGAVYRYFPTKDLIVAAVVDHVLGLSQMALQPEGPQDAHGGLETVVDRLLAVLSDPGPGDEQDRYRLVIQIWAEALRSPQVGRALQANTDALRATLAAQIQQSQARGVVRADVDAHTLARVLTALFEGYAFQRALDPDIDTDAYAATARTLLLAALHP